MGWKMRPGGGCECHGQTFCPDYVFVGYNEEDVPEFEKKPEEELPQPTEYDFYD